MLRHTNVSVGVCVYIKHLLPVCVWGREKGCYTWSPQVSLAIHCVLPSVCRGLVCSAAPESEREYTPLPGYQNYSSPPWSLQNQWDYSYVWPDILALVSCGFFADGPIHVQISLCGPGPIFTHCVLVPWLWSNSIWQMSRPQGTATILS